MTVKEVLIVAATCLLTCTSGQAIDLAPEKVPYRNLRQGAESAAREITEYTPPTSDASSKMAGQIHTIRDDTLERGRNLSVWGLLLQHCEFNFMQSITYHVRRGSYSSTYDCMESWTIYVTYRCVFDLDSLYSLNPALYCFVVFFTVAFRMQQKQDAEMEMPRHHYLNNSV